ncbi:hypothetical protein [Haliscomenobacter hydrossis]|uniref:hypothetical protein n=1 Tax=Haliscomenobacter hydrossis TaxID=2350 RepID=UPI0002DB4F56|nr:hypothetical protein [Haliscomenobacter hydrossis]
MKNQRIVLLSLLVLLGMMACKNEAKIDAETKELGPNDLLTVDAPPITGPESIAEIEKLVKSIDGQKDTLRVTGPVFVFEGKEKVDVTVYSNQEAPQLVYCKAPKVESWYYLKDRRPVYLKEIALTEDGFTQNRFYYGTKKLIGAETRKGASPDATNTGEAGKYRGEKDDFRLSGEAATGKVLVYLYGKK